MTFEEYQEEHLQGQSGEFIRLVRMGWNARGSYGNSQGILDSSGSELKPCPFCGGEAMGVVVRRDDGILVAVTDSGRVTRLDDAVAGPVRDGAQGAEPVASDEPLSCPFCGDKPEWVKDDDPSWPQVQCKNLECPISHSDWISLDAWNRRAYTQPAAKVPEELAAHIRKMIELHERRSVVLSVHMQELEELLDATPQQSDEWVRCENRLPIYPPDKLMRNMRDAHDYALNCKDDGIEGPAAIWSVQVYSAVRQWLLAQPSKDKQDGE